MQGFLLLQHGLSVCLSACLTMTCPSPLIFVNSRAAAIGDPNCCDRRPVWSRGKISLSNPASGRCLGRRQLEPGRMRTQSEVSRDAPPEAVPGIVRGWWDGGPSGLEDVTLESPVQASQATRSRRVLCWRSNQQAAKDSGGVALHLFCANQRSMWGCILLNAPVGGSSGPASVL
ncbi:hypothetical protein ASPZODRAFT_128222, partial [Penicilliopsis zonata CBS 506.65]